MQQDHVCRREVVGQHDRAVQILIIRLPGHALTLAQDGKDAVDDMVHVIHPGAQVGVVHQIEDFGNGIALLLQCPLRIAVQAPDQLDGRRGELVVVEHQKMGVDEYGDVFPRVLGNAVANRLQLLAGRVNGLPEARYFILDQVWRQMAFGDLDLAALQVAGLANGNAAGHTYAGQ
jgi:hypothetical protein